MSDYLPTAEQDQYVDKATTSRTYGDICPTTTTKSSYTLKEGTYCSADRKRDAEKVTSQDYTDSGKRSRTKISPFDENEHSSGPVEEKSTSRGNAHTSEQQHQPTNTQYIFTMYNAAGRGQINSSGQNNTNEMHVTLKALRQEELDIKNLKRKINRNSWRKVKKGITDNYRRLEEPNFIAYPEMVKLLNFYGGEYREGHSDTYKKEFGFEEDGENSMAHRLSLDNVLKLISNDINIPDKNDNGVIALVAPAGGGKTTCLRRWTENVMVSNSITDEHDYLPAYSSKFELILYIELKDIRNKQSTTIAEFLFDGNNVQKDEKIAIYKWVREHQSKVLMVLDGLDQARWSMSENLERIEDDEEGTTATIFYNIMSRYLLSDTRIVMSSREFKIAVFPPNIRPKTFIKLIGLSKNDIKTLFIQLLGEGGEHAWNAMNKDAPGLINLLSTPIFLMLVAIVCKICLREKTSFPTTITSLLIKLLSKLQGSEIMQERKHIIEIIRKLKPLAHEGMKIGSVIFNEMDLRSVGLTMEEVRDIVIKVPGLNDLQYLMDGDYILSFSHQILQEFFSACVIAGKEIKDFESFAEEFHNDKWTVVLRFTAGLVWDESLDTTMFCEISDRKEKQEILRQVLETRLKELEAKVGYLVALGYEKLEIYASLRETTNKQLVASLMNKMEFQDTNLNRYGMQIIAWIISCRRMEKVLFYNCFIDDDLMSALTEELRRMKNKPQVEYLKIFEEGELCFSNGSLNRMLEHLIVRRGMILPDIEGKLKYRALDWKNIHRLDLGGGSDSDNDLIFINGGGSVHAYLRVDSCVTMEGMFDIKMNRLDLECDEESSKDPSQFGFYTNIPVRFFQPAVTVSLMKGKKLQQLIYYKDLKEIDQKTDAEVQVYDKGAGTLVRQSHFDMKYKIYFSIDIRSNDELSRCSTLVQQYKIENIALHVKYDALDQDMQSFIQQCKGRNLILVKHPTWNPSYIEYNVEIVPYDRYEHIYSKGKWEELHWVLYWEDNEDVVS